MKEFLKDNIALVAAIALPLVLVVVFSLSTLFVRASVDDPKHSFLIATNYYSPDNSNFTFDVVSEELIISYRPEEKHPNGYYTNNSMPRLWRVNMPGRTVEEIALPIPENKKPGKVSIPGVTDVKIRNIQPGPDGYSFVSNYSYSGSFMTEIFSVDRSYSRIAVEKSGRVVPIRTPTNDYAYHSSFIGWIVNE